MCSHVFDINLGFLSDISGASPAELKVVYVIIIFNSRRCGIPHLHSAKGPFTPNVSVNAATTLQ